MTSDEFIKSLGELRVATENFLKEFPAFRKGPSLHLSSVPQILYEISRGYDGFLSASTYEERVKMHSRLRSKMSFVKTHLDDATRSCGSDLDLLARYSESLGFLGKKYEKLKESMPRTPEKTESDSCGSDERFCEKREFEVGFDGMMKKSVELYAAVESFVASYPDDKGSIVAYIRDMKSYLKSLDLIYRRFKNERNPMRIPGYLSAARVNANHIQSYLGMSQLICEYNGFQRVYSENLAYVERKVKEFMSLVPQKQKQSCRIEEEISTGD